MLHLCHASALFFRIALNPPKILLVRLYFSQQSLCHGLDGKYQCTVMCVNGCEYLCIVDNIIYRPLSRRLDRCDRVIQNESRPKRQQCVFVFSGDVYVTIQMMFLTRKSAFIYMSESRKPRSRSQWRSRDKGLYILKHSVYTVHGL